MRIAEFGADVEVPREIIGRVDLRNLAPVERLEVALQVGRIGHARRTNARGVTDVGTENVGLAVTKKIRVERLSDVGVDGACGCREFELSIGGRNIRR